MNDNEIFNGLENIIGIPPPSQCILTPNKNNILHSGSLKHIFSSRIMYLDTPSIA